MYKGITAVALSVLILSFSATVYAQDVDGEILLRHHQVPMFPQLSDQTHLLGIADAEGREQKGKRPPLSLRRIAGEIAAGWVGVFVGGYAGLAVSELLGYDARPISDAEFEGEAEWGVLLCGLGGSGSWCCWWCLFSWKHW